ncbi:MAG: phosphoribosyl-AMP cyclohydrolase [Candidatus Lokiarchaeota archaeon]|nr:phosphoribosyl-AMP cyclohydrolase [Candidatus Lokiarchaeota archaeon]
MKEISDNQINDFVDQLDFSKIEGGLLPVIAQDYETNKILMLAFSDKEAVRKTLETGYAHYYSRSRQMLWKKGETSGNVQKVKEIITDCDLDSLLYKINQIGGASCHKGYDTCFFNKLEDGNLKIIGTKCFDPEEVYNK